MTAPHISTEKAALRRRLRAERVRFASDAATIMPPPEFLLRLGTGGVIASYIAMPGEADPAALALAARERGYRIALPHVTIKDQPMRFLGWSPGDPLMPGSFGLLQPAEDAEALVPDVMLIPLIGFDSRLNRLGQGAGYYDRALAGRSAVLRIGVAWSMQRCDTLPVDPWDVPMDGIVTELGWLDPETDA